MPTRVKDLRPLVVHVVYRLDVGGLENGVVNLINAMPEDSFRHMIISLTEVTDFRLRIRRDDVECLALNKPEGHSFRLYNRLRRLFRQLQPTIVHTRNLAALEAQVPAWLAGVPVRIHGEHGRDVSDLTGSNTRYRWIRRLFSPWVQRYVTVSRDLESYLIHQVGIASRRVHQIYNGVDAQRFSPHPDGAVPIPGTQSGKHLVLGWVGRLQPVKDPLILVEVMRRLISQDPTRGEWLRLALVGDGPLMDAVRERIAAYGLETLVWLPGSREDIPELLRAMHLFLLPSQGEGISNTVLEAMASGLPVLASDVGGNPELVQPGKTGELIPAGDVDAWTAAVARYLHEPDLIQQQGGAARRLVEERFSLEAMVSGYQLLYQNAMAAASVGTASGQAEGQSAGHAKSSGSGVDR